MDEARDNDNEATLKVLEAEVARRQHELDADQDDVSDGTSSSSPMDDDQDVDMQLTEGDHWYVLYNPISHNLIHDIFLCS